MNLCSHCGSEMLREVRGDFTWQCPYAGVVTVRNVVFDQCPTCGAVNSFPCDTVDALQRAGREAYEAWAATIPDHMWVDAATAAKWLHMRLATFLADRRIARGFIYQTQRNGVTVYHRASVEQYGEYARGHGDGRFNIHLAEVCK